MSNQEQTVSFSRDVRLLAANHLPISFSIRSDGGNRAFREVGTLPLLLPVAKLTSKAIWDQTNAGLTRGTSGGGMVRASIWVTSLMLGRSSGFGLEHASPNNSKRLMSSTLTLMLPNLVRPVSAASKSLFSPYNFQTQPIRSNDSGVRNVGGLPQVTSRARAPKLNTSDSTVGRPV